LFVEREVELEHVDARLAEQPEPAAVGLFLDQLLNRCERQVANSGDAMRLELRVVERDLGIDP